MPDYGLPLTFGTFITPSNRDPQAPVALAQLSERLGYDLVTFQDHPYQPAFLDTFTLMSWVAAQTTSIHIAPNVLSTPMRPPAVTARAAASLDLLSGGRFDLGLGAGAFWDAIEAMGGRRLTPGQAVDALSEAIDVIRGIWATDDRSPLVAGGDYYSVHGAKRGPTPAHAIPLWVGAYKPRMLRLTGTKADGWLPSLAYLKPGDLAEGNARIDEAALEAGRDPREIRRLLNIGPDMTVEQLLPLVLEHGMATFILAGDDPRLLQQFAEEVMPALRDEVRANRAVAGTVETSIRSSAALAKRRSGIDYDAIPSSLAATAVEPGDIGFAKVRSTYLRGGSPGLVLRPADVSQVQDALAYARAQNVPLAVRSGGHGISGRSTNDGGIVIDLHALSTIEVIDEATRRVRIGPGARWVDVAAALGEHGWALSSGDYGGVGVGGLATAGGIGWLVREHGLTIDHLRAAELVLADGSAVRVGAAEHPPATPRAESGARSLGPAGAHPEPAARGAQSLEPAWAQELFWAVRGAGANVGIVTAFEFEVDEVGDLGWAQLAFDAGDTADFLEQWGRVVEQSPRDLTSFLIMGAKHAGRQHVAQVLSVVDSDDPDTIIERLQPLAETAPLLQQSVQLTTYPQLMANVQPGDHDGRGEPLARSGLIGHITPEFASAVAALLETGEVYYFQIRSVGGAVADVAPDATAYANRAANFSVVAFGSHPDRMNALWDDLLHHFDGLYLSFETDQRAGRLEEAFPPATLARLRAVKQQFDPDNVFRDNFNVAPTLQRMG